MKHTYSEKQIYNWFCEQADIIINLYDNSVDHRIIKQNDLSRRLLYKLQNRLSEAKPLNKAESPLPHLQSLCAIKYNLEHYNAVASVIGVKNILEQTSFLSNSIKESIILIL